MKTMCMTAADYGEVYALWTRTKGMGLRDGDDDREGVERFLARNPGCSFVAREDDGRLIGSILCGHDGRRGHIYHTAVAEEARGRGVGRLLVNCALEALHRDLGADGIISGGQTMNPSTEDILKEINSTPAQTVFVLPNNKNIVLAAEQCVGMSEKNVIVIPTSTVPQGVTAMLALDPEAEAEANREAMNEAIGTVHPVTLTYAARNSVFDDIEIVEGDYLAMLENKLLAAGAELEAIEKEIGSSLASFEPEIVSVYYGEDVTEEQARALAEVLQELMPDAEVSAISGGQPVYYYIISAE